VRRSAGAASPVFGDTYREKATVAADARSWLDARSVRSLS
jgi:hypothetical protein